MKMYLDQTIKYKKEKWKVVRLNYTKGELMFITLRNNTGTEITTTPGNLQEDRASLGC